jgi:RNA polymerase sigma-B factor
VIREAAAAEAERRRLIEAYLPLVNRVASRFAGWGERSDDLAQVGALALVQAVDRRDPARPGALPAYVSRCVEGEIRRYLRDHAASVRLPRAVHVWDWDDPAVATARRPLRLDDDDVAGATKALDDQTLARALVARAAQALDCRERQIVLLRFFLDRTQEEVARTLGLSQAHVSRLLDEALAKMRRRLERDETWYQAQRRATLEQYGRESRATRGA